MTSCVVFVMLVFLPCSAYVGRYHIMALVILGGALLLVSFFFIIKIKIFLSGGHLGFHHPGHLRLGRIKLEGRPGHQQASESQSSHWIPQVIFCLSCCFLSKLYIFHCVVPDSARPALASGPACWGRSPCWER